VYLVQLLLPLYGRDSEPLPRGLFESVARELTDRFGGMTAYARSPASGLWEGRDGQAKHDDIIVHEVMTEKLDRNWWAEYRAALETRFQQDELVVRALPIERL
jgi:hypothetical protein